MVLLIAVVVPWVILAVAVVLKQSAVTAKWREHGVGDRDARKRMKRVFKTGRPSGDPNVDRAARRLAEDQLQSGYGKRMTRLSALYMLLALFQSLLALASQNWWAWTLAAWMVVTAVVVHVGSRNGARRCIRVLAACAETPT